MPQVPAKTTARLKRSSPAIRRALLHAIRLIGVGATGILGAFLIFQLVIKVAHPYQLGDEEARKVAALRDHLARQEKRNEELDARLKYLASDEGIETQARRTGYHREGEIVFMLDKNALSETQALPSTPQKK